MAATYISDGNVLWLCVAKVGTPPPWQPGVNYKTGDVVVPRFPTVGQATLAFQAVGTLMSSGFPEPAFPSVVTSTIVDGGMIWIARDKTLSPPALPPNEYFKIAETVTVT